MQTLLKPFKGLRPTQTVVADVVAPPYDVINRQQAAMLAKDNPYSFLHISKPEIDLPDDMDAYDPQVYQQGKHYLQQMRQQDVFVQDQQSCYYRYQIQQGDRIQTGLVAVASVEAYQQQRIIRHEFTLPKKEDDRVNNITALQAQMSPVLLTFRHDTALASVISDLSCQHEYEVLDQEKVIHCLSVISDQETIMAITKAADQLPSLYIADGHHRSAAAERVHQQCHTAATGYFLTVLFPDDSLNIEGYHRVVNDIAPYTAQTLLTELAKNFVITSMSSVALPQQPYHFAMYLNKQWHQLQLKMTPSIADPVASLDVSVLMDVILRPLFSITDPCRDPRLEFIGGKHSLTVLADKVDNSAKSAVAFALPPTQMQQLLSVADQHKIMPPKSTWFSPKLLDGLVSYLF